jgi:hypothetical protein
VFCFLVDSCSVRSSQLAFCGDGSVLLMFSCNIVCDELLFNFMVRVSTFLYLDLLFWLFVNPEFQFVHGCAVPQ